MEDSLNIWIGRIERAKALQYSQHKKWEEAIQLYNCEYFQKVFKIVDPDRVDVNFVNWYVDNLVPLVYFRDPFIFVKPRHDRVSSFADTMETVINYTWLELSLKQEFKRVIKSGLLMPPGWLKLGYTADIGQDVAKHEENLQKGIIEKIKDVLLNKKEKEEKEEKLPEEQGILNEYIKEESIFATWISSWNMLMPVGYQLVSQMPWLVEIEDIPKIDFVRNPHYKNKDKAKPSREVEDKDENSREIRTATYNKTEPLGIDDENSIIRLYHIWDRRNQRRYTISEQDFHFKGDWPYDIDGFPYEPLIFDESLPSLDKSNPYPPNVVIPILPQVIEQSMARTMMCKHRKRASAIILAQKGVAQEEDLNQLEQSDAVQIAYVSNPQSFIMTATPPIPQEVFAIDEIIKQDLQMATNMGQMMFAAQKGQRTATQAQIGQSGLQLKASARVDVVEDFTVRVARKIAQLAWQFYDRDKVSEIIGEDVSESMWLKLPDDKRERKRIIQSELQLKIDAGSTAPPKDETIDRKQLLDYASIVSTIAPERIKKDEFIKQLTKKFKFVKDVDKIVISSDDEEIKAATEENQLLSNDVPQVVGPNENHIIHIQTHSQIQKPTRSSDLHISDHGKFVGIKEGEKKSGVGNQPQQGDKRPPMRSARPEITRQGGTEGSDIMQSAQNMGATK